jgi:hypothetical protein
MTPPIRSFLRANWSITTAALLTIASGCSERAGQTGTLTPILNADGVITYRYVGTESAASTARQRLGESDQARPARWLQDELELQRQRREQADLAYESYRQEIRQRQQVQAWRLNESPADASPLTRINEILGDARRKLQADQQRRWDERQRAESDARRQSWAAAQQRASEAAQVQRDNQALHRMFERMREQGRPH